MYSLDGFMAIVQKVRQRYPDFNFTTDIIVGFPGESTENFEQSMTVAKEIGFGHIHTFKYSVRKGTRAARMEDHIPEKEKTRRSEVMRQLAECETLKYRQSMLGKEQTVLVEKVLDGMAQGYGENYIPVKFPTDIEDAVNTFVKVRLESIIREEDFVRATVIR